MEKLTKQYLYQWMSENYSFDRIYNMMTNNGFSLLIFDNEQIKLFYKF